MLAARRSGAAEATEGGTNKVERQTGKDKHLEGESGSFLASYLPPPVPLLGASEPPAHPVFLFTASAATQFSIVERPSDNAEIARQYLPEGNPGWKME